DLRALLFTNRGEGVMRRASLCAFAIAVVSVAAPHGARWNFLPDWTFKGNDLKKDWTVLGQATWQAANGELIGTPTSPEGGWLVWNKCLQDFQFGADLKCSAECKAGVLVRARRQPEGGLTGIFVPYGVGETDLFIVTRDASGRETARSPLEGGSIGNMVRYAPLPVDPNASGRGRGAGRGDATAAGGAATRAAAPPARP